MASKKKKKKSFSEQVISGTYESSLTKDKVDSALKSNNESITKANSQKDSLFSAFDDGYDFGDVSRTILKGASKVNPFNKATELGKDAGTVFGMDPVGTLKSIGSGIKEGAINVKDKAVNVGKEVVKDPIGSLKAGGVGILSGIDKADTLVNNAVDDFFDWIVPGREDKDKGLTLKEFNQLSSATDEKTKKKLLKEYEEKYGKDSATYKTIKLQLETDPKEANALNWKYTDSDTYKDLQAGELSEGKQTVYETGETIGQMIPAMGVSTVAGPLAGTGVFFTQTQQSYTEQALADGYTESDARKYGIIMGTAEVVVERLGFDELGGLDKLASYSIKKAMFGEGAEEFVMPYIDSTVKTLGFGEEFDVEGTVAESIEGAVMGATVGVIMNAGGRGLQSVDKVIQKAQNGQEISQDELLQATKEIEENYPELLEEAMAVVPEVVQQEIQNESINVVPGKEQDDIAPVGEIDTTEIDEIAPVVAKEVLQPTLVSGQDVRVAGQQDIAPVEAPVQDNRYVYTPQETDSQYKQAVSKSAETVGLENNASTQTMIELATKVSERTGKQILFTNEAQPEMLTKKQGLINSYAKANNISVEEASARLQGTTINGLTDGDTILINTDSNGYLNVIVGHEITHTFENLGKLYDELQDAVTKYAQAKGEYAEISETLGRIYAGTNANIDQEITSELVGRYLFTDQAFIDSLKASKPNVFQRMYNEIKHLIKMATAGSKEARALEEVKYRFEKAMNKVASDETSKVTVQETKDKSTTERLSNTKKEFSLEKELEKDLESKIMDKKAQIDFFENYLEEEGITNPTERDMYDSWGTYEQMDSDMDSYVEAEKEYYKTIREYLKDRLSTDNKGRELSKEQIEFFKDSVVRDEEGRLLTLYHGTGKEFYAFDMSKAGQNYEDGWSEYGQGFYFTPDYERADDFAVSSEGDSQHIKEVYANVENPLYTYERYPELFKEYNLEANVYNGVENNSGSEFIRLINARDGRDASTKILKSKGYDGIINSFGEGIDEVVVFESNQVKDVTNTNPTESDDIRYSLSDNKGYHYGDLGKARDTYYWNINSSRRSTGHFGTGTYFVSEAEANRLEKSPYFSRKDRAKQEVNFNEYNLYKPMTDTEAFTLHDSLKAINYGEYDNIDVDIVRAYFKRAGISQEQFDKAIEKVKATRQEYTEKSYDDDYEGNHDSLSTVFMKELGFNGIDVRGLERVDNTTYGSVIYDLDNKISSEDIRYSLTSDKANTTYVQELNKTRAKMMKENNKTDSDIWLATGYQYNEEIGRWQTEVADPIFKANQPMELNKEYSLEEVVDADELFRAYPELRGVKVKRTDFSDIADTPQELDYAQKSVRGTTTDDGIILINEKIKSRKIAGEVLTHEVQHLIQEIEGYDTNHQQYLMQDATGKYYMTSDYLKDATEREARQVQNRYNMSETDRRNVVPKETSSEIDMTRYSLSVDNQGRELSKEQQEFFKDSKVRDENGSLKTMYHGTPSGGFNVFDKTKMNTRDSGFLGKGFYFTEDMEEAELYSYEDYIGQTGENSEVKEVYLNITNPFVIPSETTYNSSMLSDLLGVPNELIQNYLKKQGYDGIIYDSKAHNEYVVFNSNQIKNVDNTKPTSDEDIRYSLSEDNEGNEINPAMQKWAENSKARDENGQLKVLYHGSPSGEFTVFDKNKANPEGDWGSGFYLTDSEYDVEENYADGGPDFDNKVSRIAEQIELDEDISYEEAKEKARKQLYKGYYRIDAYANIENPAIVGETYLFSGYEDNYNIDDFESEEEYYEAIDQLVADDIDTAIWEIERTYDFYNGTDGIREVLWEAYSNGGMEIQELKDKLGELYLETDEGLVGSDVARIIIESQGYDGIIDPTVSSKFKGMYLNKGTTHYIVFKPNQIKEISNENPTDDPDIYMSLSKEGEELAPIGDFNIKGSDVRLQKQVEEAIAPLKAEIETLTKTITDLQEDIAPASFESAEEQRAETQRTMTDEDAPNTDDGEFIFTEDVPLKGKGKDSITREIANDFGIKYTEARELYNKVANTENPTVEDVFDILSDYREVKMQMDLDEVNAIQHTIKGTRIDVSEFKNQITDYKNYRISNMGKGLILGNSGEKVDSVYQELNEMYGDNAFPSSVTAEVDQLDVISQWLYKEPYLEFTDTIDDDSLYDLAERVLSDVGNTERYKSSEAYRTNWFRHYKDDIMAPGEAPRIKTEISQEDYLKSLPDALTDDYAPYLEQAREVNASNTENSTGNTSISDELSRLSINPQEEVNEAQNGPKYEIERPLENPFDDFLDNFKRTVSKPKANAPRVTKEKPGLKSAYGTVQELIFNDTYQIDKLAKETNRPSIKHNNYMLKGVYGEIPGDILVGQTDNYGNVIGLSVKDLWQPAHDSGLFEQFNDRMKHQLNIERWKTNKPLWYEIPAEASQEIVKAYDETYPEFKEWAEDIYNFYANSLDNKYEAGLVNDAQRKLLREELYPSYVRIDVEQLEKPYVDITPGEIRSKAPLKRAVGGSGSSAMSLEESMIKSVYADKMGIRQNKLYLEIAKALESNRAEVGADVRQELADMSEALYLDADTGQHYLTAYENGEQFTVEIDKELYDGLKNDLKQTLKNIETKLGKPLELVQKAGNLKRDLTTTYNPFFWLTNPPKDLFDGFINSKHVGRFAKNYIPAWKEAITNTGDAPQFRALYGSAMDMGDYSAESGLGDTDGRFAKWAKNTKLLRGINKLNEVTEIATRLAEFKASKEAGASLEEAMYNAREVTVNFDRGGTLTKFLDRNGFKFLNVSAQGFDKFIRNFSGQEGARATMGAWARALVFGVAPALINHLLFGGDDDEEKDEDYEALPDYIKDNYFLFKMDNGEFIRIPKGRMMAVFGSAGRRTLEFLGGEEDAYEGFFENSESQVGMANPFDNFLLAPLFQAYGSENGTTWYGEELIPSRLQDKAPEEQYDASTDKASIFLGELFGISPYKLNYVIDQYTGGIGDLVLPMITEETKTDGSLMAPFIDKFTANSTDDNKYASEIYSLGDKRDKVPTAEKETDLYKIQDAYLYSITSEMGELYAEKREVQADSSLSKSEKYERVQEIQRQINDLAKEGLGNYEYVSQKENYAIVGGREFNKYTASDGTERWGTPWEDELNDLNSMGMDLAEKNNYFTSKKYITEINDHYKDLIDNASEEEKDGIYAERKREVIKAVQDTDLNDEMKAYLYNKYYSSDKTKVITMVGIDFDTYLDFESQQFEADKNSAGKSISGSKKAKVFAYINSMNLDFEERLILAKLQYNSYDTYNAEIINYLNNNSDISYDEEVEILQKLGFTVDANGRIYWD